MKNINLPEEYTIPKIFLARQFSLTNNMLRPTGRYSTLYEVSLYYESTGTIEINNTLYNIKAGDIRFTKPGSFLKSTPTYSCFTINFHFGETDTIYHNQILDNISEYLSTDGSLKKYFEEIIKRENSSNPTDKIYQTSLLMQIITVLYEISIQKNPYTEVVTNCIKYLEENYYKQISLKELGDFSGYSDVHLLRLFKKDTGKTPHDYLTELRIRHAKEMLNSTDLTIEAISFECGFKSTSHFKTLFKSYTGLTPGNYRKNTTIIF